MADTNLSVVGVNVNSPNVEVTVSIGDRATMTVSIPEVELAGKTLNAKLTRVLAEVKSIMTLVQAPAPLPDEYKQMVGRSGTLK